MIDNASLNRPVQPAPWYVWPVATVAAVVTGAAVTSPTLAVLILGGVLLVGLALFILAQPVRGFAFTLALFPFYTLLRGIAQWRGVPAPLSLVGMWPEGVLSIMFASLLCRQIRRGRRLPLTWWDMPVLILIASPLYALVLTLVEQAPAAALYGVHASVTGFLFYFVARWLEPTARDMRRLIAVWLVSYSLLAVASFADYILRPNFMIEIAILLRPDFSHGWEPHRFFKWYPRMQSLLFAEQVWGTISVFVSIYCLSLMSVGRRPRWLVPLYLLSSLGVALSMSRGALACWLMAAAVMFCFRGRHRLALLLTLVTIGAALVAVSRWLPQHDIYHSLVARVASLADPENRVAYDRVDQWTYALDNVPLFPAGRGLGRAGTMALSHGTGDGSAPIADGGYFKILAEQGIPGLLLFVVGAIGFLGVLYRLFWGIRGGDPRDRALCLALFCLMWGLLVQNVGGNLFDAYYIPAVYWMLAGLLMARREADLAVPVAVSTAAALRKV